MKIYKTQSEVEADIKDDVLNIKGDVKFECSININASIIVTGSITAWDINAWNIITWYINAWNINAENINAGYINAGDINAENITALDINALDINAWNINAANINAKDISYYAFCCVYKSIKCTSISGRRDKHHSPICLDGKLEIVKEKKCCEDQDDRTVNFCPNCGTKIKK